MKRLLFLFTLLMFHGSWAQDFECLSGDCKNGFGTLKFPSGGIYEGYFVDGNFHGKGTLTYAEDQTTYAGTWVNHELLNGTITRKYSGGTYIYTGELKGLSQNGKGKAEWIELKTTYEGDWKDGLRHGQGTQVDKMMGETYEGGWVEDQKSGYGKEIETMFFPQTYSGYFLKNKRNGQGTCTYENGAVYVGEWKDDKRDGAGTYTWPNGWKFEGTYAAGEPSNGKLTDGAFVIHEGPFGWKEHRMSFFDGELLGPAEFRRSVSSSDSVIDIVKANGTYYVGEHFNKYGPTWTPNGQGILVQKNGAAIIGEFESGVLKDTLEVLPFIPTLSNYIAYQGEALNALGLHYLAMEKYEKALEVDAENPVAYTLQGRLFLAVGDTTQSLESMNNALSYDPEFKEALQTRANLLYHTKKYKEALKDAEKLSKIEPDNINAWWYLGLSSLELKKYATGAEAISKVLETFPDPQGNVHYYLGLCYEGLKDTENACKAFSTALSKGWSDAQEKLGDCP